jgi:hypothetical protein
MMLMWDSLYIYCFSGTGNALASSKWIADEAGKRGIKPFHYLVRYTSLTTIPFWRRYKPGKPEQNKNHLLKI